MANMSYCRFENTLHAFRDCLAALQEEGMYTLKSQSERDAAEALVRTAKRFIKAYEEPASAEDEDEDESVG